LILLCLVASLACALVVPNNSFLRRRSSTKADPGHDIAKVIALEDHLKVLSTSPEANRKFWEDFFRRFDVDGQAGLSKNEFFAGLDNFVTSNGLRHHPQVLTDALFDDINSDKNDVLSLEEAVFGSQAVFDLLRNSIQNLLRHLAFELYQQKVASKCQDLRNALNAITAFPSVLPAFARSWDTDNSGRISKEEVLKDTRMAFSLLYVDDLSQEEMLQLFRQFDTDQDGQLSDDEAGKFLHAYFQQVVNNACASSL